MEQRFVIANNEKRVSVLDTQNEATDENLEVFSIYCETIEDANIIAEELYDIVRTLNEQDKIMKKHNLTLW